MKNKSKFAFVAFLLVVVVSVAALCACVDDNDEKSNSYEIPADLNIGVSFFSGDANNLLGMVTKSSFTEAAQSVITVNDAVYVAYKVGDLTAGFDLPASFTSVRLVFTDETQKDLSLTSFASSYIAVGVVENDALTLAEAPYFIVDSASTASDNVFGGISRVYIDPVMDDAPKPIAAEDRFDLGLISISEVAVLAGNEQLFSFKKNDLSALDQYLVTLTAENKKYVGFKFTDIVAAKGAVLPENFTSVKAGSPAITKELSSFDNAYLLVRKADDPSYEELNNIPRFVFDYTAVAEVNSDVAKAVTSIIIDPEETAATEDVLLATLTLEWDGLDLSIALDDVSGATDDATIVISTPDTLPESVTALSVGGKTVAGKFTSNALMTKSTNENGDFYGYSLNDILACLGKINKQGEFKPADYQVSYIKYTVSSNGENVVSDVISEAADFGAIGVINYTSENPPTRVYLSSGNVKKVVAISLYQSAQ